MYNHHQRQQHQKILTIHDAFHHRFCSWWVVVVLMVLIFHSVIWNCRFCHENNNKDITTCWAYSVSIRPRHNDDDVSFVLSVQRESNVKKERLRQAQSLYHRRLPLSTTSSSSSSRPYYRYYYFYYPHQNNNHRYRIADYQDEHGHDVHFRPWQLHHVHDDAIQNNEGDDDDDKYSLLRSITVIPEQYQKEDTLLQIHFDFIDPVTVDSNTTTTTTTTSNSNETTMTSLASTAYMDLVSYLQHYPYATKLPVQPMSYFATPDHGIEIQFLRKKTDIKSSHDGGIRFFVQMMTEHTAATAAATATTAAAATSSNTASISHSTQGDESDDDFDDHDDDVDDSNDMDDGRDRGRSSDCSILLTAKRNSIGQVIPKMFAEKIIITSLVQSLCQSKTETPTTPTTTTTTTTTTAPPLSLSPTTTATAQSTSNIPPTQKGLLSIRSIFHKWMSTVTL
jgi:hypothetical protein